MLGTRPLTARTLRNTPEFFALGNSLRSLCNDREFAYFQISGNWGDSLIRQGARLFFEAERLSARNCYARDRTRQRFSFKTFPPRKRWELDAASLTRFTDGCELAVISGGGGWCPAFSSSRNLARVLLEYCERVVVLPHSYALPPVEGDVVYYCRDVDYSRSSVVGSIFCHDMALYLEPDGRDAIEDVGFFFRGDRESQYGLSHLTGNVDLSRLDNELGDPDVFIDYVGRYRRVVTDRLHVAIAGALLGRKTYVLDGAYWKIRSVYEASLRPNFPNVHFCATLGDLPDDIKSRLHR
jgi:CDP-glycerol glycerophosphotransferase